MKALVDVYSVPSRVWTVPSLSAWKFWKNSRRFRPRRAVGFDHAGGAIESNCPSGSKSSRIFQNFHADRDGTVHTLDGREFNREHSKYVKTISSTGDCAATPLSPRAKFATGSLVEKTPSTHGSRSRFRPSTFPIQAVLDLIWNWI